MRERSFCLVWQIRPSQCRSPTVGSSIDHWSSIVVSGVDEHLFGDERIPACFVRFHLKLGAVATDC